MHPKCRDSLISGVNHYLRQNEMNRKRREVESRWLTSRQPSQRTDNEAQKFADECWAGGLRLSTSPPVHYDLVMSSIRWSLIR